MSIMRFCKVCLQQIVKHSEKERKFSITRFYGNYFGNNIELYYNKGKVKVYHLRTRKHQTVSWL